MLRRASVCSHPSPYSLSSTEILSMIHRLALAQSTFDTWRNVGTKNDHRPTPYDRHRSINMAYNRSPESAGCVRLHTSEQISLDRHNHCYESIRLYVLYGTVLSSCPTRKMPSAACSPSHKAPWQPCLVACSKVAYILVPAFAHPDYATYIYMFPEIFVKEYPVQFVYVLNES